MRTLLSCTFILLLSFNIWAQERSVRIKYNFNPDWKVFVGDPEGAASVNFNDSKWKTVTLPYAWNEDQAFKKDIVDLSTGISWYRKHFKLPSDAKGKKVFIEFEGIRQAGDVYLNGKYIGRHENGVMAFGFDLSEEVNRGKKENVLAVRIDNDWDYKEKTTQTKFQWEDRNFNSNYGGITKNVSLHVTGDLYQTLPLYSALGTTGVYIFADDYNIEEQSAIVHAESEVKNESKTTKTVHYEVALSDLEGKEIARFGSGPITIQAGETRIVKAAARVDNLHFWSWGYGYLYDVETVLKIDEQQVDVIKTRTGFRKTAFKDGMIYLNDRVIQVHGYAQRTTNEWPAIGQSVPPWLSDYSNGLMVEGNANLVRWMHLTPWKQDVESCDRVGLLQAMPAGDAEGDVKGVRWDQRKSVMCDAIIYNRNNPSIVFYESGNDGISEEHMQEMLAIRDQFDPYGGRAIGSREMLDSEVAEYGGEMLYINKSAEIPLWAMEYSRDEGHRKYWDAWSPPFHEDGDGPLYKGKDASEYNRNQDSHAIENIRRWYDFWLERPGTGRRVSSGGVNIVFSETNTHHRGAENYRRSGEVDALRIFKQNYFANQVMWDGWVDIEKPRIHIIGHWNYTTEVSKPIYVASSADSVELKINGRSVGFGKQSYRFLFTFDSVNWEPGTISAIGYDSNGGMLCTTEIETAGPPTALRLTPLTSPGGWRADGHDLALVEVEVVDEQGRRCPTALHMIDFSLEGAAEWRGGMALGPDNYILAKRLPVEGGVNRVLLRATTKPGTIVLEARSKGLTTAKLTLQTQSFPVKNGLSTQLPSAGLPSDLGRGPTPRNPSFEMSRIPVAITNVSAGANAELAAASYDDNELTDWYNDGEMASAWIEYDLEREAILHEVTLKLNNFRSRIYPLRITVDGQDAFSGTTRKSLGYVTLSLKPVKGKKVRIMLQDEAAIAGDKMIEVTGKKLDDGVRRDDAKKKDRLSIIEVEFYEPSPNSEM